MAQSHLTSERQIASNTGDAFVTAFVTAGLGDSWSPKSIEELLGEKGVSPFAPIRFGTNIS